MKCPGRLTSPQYVLKNLPNEDNWEYRSIFKNDELNKFCSFCGSLHPKIFLDLVEKGAILVPTDKNYKAYIEYQNSTSKFYFWHLSKSNISRYIKIAEQRKINFAFPGFFYKKPFFLLFGKATPFSFGAIISIEEKIEDGSRINLIKPIYSKLVEMLKKDPNFIYKINPRIWEEIIAASYDKAGFDEVILTPRSGDLGRDVIAIKKGFGSIRFIEQVKAYNPNHIVTADEVRALLGVLSADHNATKAIFTTTSSFAPKITDDKLIKQYLPYRLELIDKQKLIERILND